MLDLGIMTCGQIVSAQGECLVEEEAKLYVLVAGNAGVGSPTLLVFPAEIVNHTGLKFLPEVNLMVGNVQDAADIFCSMRLVLEVR
jgi:hypothetical protein